MFFPPQDVLKLDYFLNFVVSKRGAGKTFSSIKYGIERFLETGKQFVYLRRLETEIEDTEKTILINQQSNGFFTDKKFTISKGVMFCDGKQMGFLVAISTAYKLKSIAFPNVDLIIFDEFISENKKYLKNECQMFLSVIETIVRMRDAQILCLANQITIFNPYYVYFDVYPHGVSYTKFKSKDILILQYENKDYTDAKNKTRFAKLIQNTSYGNFMLNNENINDNYSFIENLKGIKKDAYLNIIINNVSITVFDIMLKDDYFLYFETRKQIEGVETINFDKILKENATIESAKNNKYSKRISVYLKRGQVRFKDMLAKETITQFIF